MEEKDIADDIRWNTTDTAWTLWDAPWENGELDAFDPEEYRAGELEWINNPNKPEHRLNLELDVEGVHIGSVCSYCLNDELEWKALEPGEDRAPKWPKKRIPSFGSCVKAERDGRFSVDNRGGFGVQ